MTDRDLLQQFMFHVQRMRTHQKDYFARKMPADLKQSKLKERDVDYFLSHLRRKGYVPVDSKIEQNKLF